MAKAEQCNHPLPRGWIIMERVTYGTGNGDELYMNTLYHWDTLTKGHLWWKKTWLGWRAVRSVRSSHDTQELIDYAVFTQEMLNDARKEGQQ